MLKVVGRIKPTLTLPSKSFSKNLNPVESQNKSINNFGDVNCMKAWMEEIANTGATQFTI
jgi:hypothetical protein